MQPQACFNNVVIPFQDKSISEPPKNTEDGGEFKANKIYRKSCYLPMTCAGFFL